MGRNRRRKAKREAVVSSNDDRVDSKAKEGGQDPDAKELRQYLLQMKQFDPNKWQAAFQHRQRMATLSSGSYDPGSAVLKNLNPGEIGVFIPSGKARATVSVCLNPASKSSFGFVGSFGEVVSKASFLPGILVMRFDPRKLKGVSRQTLCLFRWDSLTKSYRRVASSGVGLGGDYVWARITLPSKYAIIGLNAHPLVIRTIAVAEDLIDLIQGVKPAQRKKLQDQLCAMLMGCASLRKAIQEPKVLDRLIEGSWPRDFPNPMEAYKPNPGFENLDDLMDRCQRMHVSGWPEGQLLPGSLSGWRPGGFTCTDAGWQNVGPLNVSGCVLQVTIDPSDHHRLYAAAADGGIWKLDDVTRYPAGTWIPLTDQNATLRTSAVAVSPSRNSWVYMGDGLGRLLRSESGGSFWYLTSNTNLDYIRKIIVHPTDRDLVYLVTNSGFWRSRDGGATWDSNPGQTTLYDGANWADVLDAAMDPGDASILYLAVRNVGLLKSYTSGERWLRMLAWDPTHWYWSNPDRRGSTMIKIGLGNLGSDSNRTVAVKFGEEVFVNHNGGRGPDESGGGAWISKGMGGGDGQGDWDHVIAVDPFDNQVILAGAQELMRTEDGGDHWDTVIRYYSEVAHVDQQSIIFDHTERNVVYISNDGGVFRSVDDGRTWNDLNQGLVTAQFARAGIAGNEAITGMYHEGIAASPNLTTRQWSVIEGGSWEFSNIDGDPRRSFYFYLLGIQLDRRRYPGTGTDDFIIPFGNFPANCIAVDPRSTSTTLLVGSSNPGRVVRALDGTAGAPTWTTEPGIILGSERIVSIAFAPSRPGLAYAVTQSGKVFRKVDVNTARAWVLQGQWAVTDVMQVAVNPLHEDRIYLVAGNQAARSEDGGGHWTPMPGSGTNTLPNTNYRAMACNPHDGLTLYLAQDIGVFASPDEGQNWHPYNDALPNAAIVEILWQGGYLYAVTGGRGLWRRRPCL